jgi:hypothetical protein
LRPLIVVTGTIHVEGGAKNKQTTTNLGEDQTRSTIFHEREISKDRRHANVIVIAYLRHLRALRIAKTPFGTLCEPSTLPAIKALLQEATRDVIAFNRKSKVCKLSNCYIWEPLSGNRLAAVEGWLSRRLRDGDPEVKTASDTLYAAAA